MKNRLNGLYETLEAYGQSDYYPYHMPGHKRQESSDRLANIRKIDITEIDGFDNLHRADGILAEAQERAAKLYGAQESYFLVNGSTCGILSAVSAALPEGGHLLMTRNCHKSVYHAVYLRSLRTTFLYPPMQEEYGIYAGIPAKQIQEALESDDTIQAVLITSPTYEGVCSDVGAIAKVAHAHGIPLIVDAAHGAHFGMHPDLPEKCSNTADLVIHSLHKTLPSLTQTALLHKNGSLVDSDRLKRFLSIYQTSSPSYVFMADMDRTVRDMQKEGTQRFQDFLQRRQKMLEKLQELLHIRILMQEELPDFAPKKLDPCKFVISVANTKMTGTQLYDKLLYRFHLQMEMAAGSYVLAILTIADTEEGFDRLADALLAIDKEFEPVLQEQQAGNGQKTEIRHAETVMSLREAWDLPKEQVPLELCAGRIAGEFLYLYPPGIPLAVPGELIPDDLPGRLQEYEQRGLSVTGLISSGSDRMNQDEQQERRLYYLCVKQKSFVQ